MKIMPKKHIKEPWQILKLIIKSGRGDEWIAEVKPFCTKFFLKNSKDQWLIFEHGEAIVEIPNQVFSVDLMRVANPVGKPYHELHDKLGGDDEFDPDELHLLRALYEICRPE